MNIELALSTANAEFVAPSPSTSITLREVIPHDANGRGGALHGVCSEGEGEVEEATPDPDTILPAAPPAAGHFVIGVCIIHKQDQEGGLLSHQSTLFLFSSAYAYVLKMRPEAKVKAH
eukprot:scaffold37790_cov216-Skeletonema_marinoi.AAC.3